MTDRFLPGVHVRDGWWAGRAARHGRRIVVVAVHGIGRSVGIAPRAHGRGRPVGTRLRHAAAALRVMPMALHRRVLAAGLFHSERAAHHAEPLSGQVTRTVARAVAGGEGRARGFARFGTPGRFPVLRQAALVREAPRVVRADLLRGVRKYSFSRSRQGGFAMPGWSLAPPSRGGGSGVSTETMRRDFARGAAHALRHENRSLDAMAHAPGSAGHVLGGAESGHALPDRLHDAKGPLPTDLRDEVQHALHEVKLNPRAEMRRLFAEESRRPPSGVTGFDHRLAPIWPGRKPGY